MGRSDIFTFLLFLVSIVLERKTELKSAETYSTFEFFGEAL